MSREEELEVVTTAYFLEERISELQRDKEQLYDNKPHKPTKPTMPKEPAQPEKVEISPLPYPTITPDQIQMPGKWKRVLIVSLIVATVAQVIPFIGMLISLILYIGGIYYTIKIYRQERAEKKRLQAESVERIRNSAEYREKCQEIDEQNRIRQAQKDEEIHNKYVQRYAEYQMAMQQYEENTKQYDADVRVYEEEQIPEWKEERESLRTAMDDTQNTLQEVYNRNIIPVQYRKLEALVYLAVFLNTSQYDLKFAIENYNQYIIQRKQDRQIDLQEAQLQIARETLSNQQYANWLHEQSIEMSEQGNKTLKSISNWQKADISYRMYEKYKNRKARKKSR